MDLSFPPFDRAVELTILPGDLAVLMVGVAARQAASPTAIRQADFARVRTDPRPFAPLDGTFNAGVAAAMLGWRAA